METNKIKILHNSNIICTIDSTNPDFDQLIEFIVKNIEEIDCSKISINQADENFDEESFKEIITSVITSYKKKYDLNAKYIQKLKDDIEKIHKKV